MKRYYRLIATLLIAIPVLCFANKRLPNIQNLPIPSAIQKISQVTLDKRAQQAHIGIIIQSMKTGKILYQQNANKLFTPASVQKLLTAAVALNYLKPSYLFTTQIFTQGKIQNHTLKGNLFIKFTGDPELTNKELKHLLHQISNKGIRHITGRVYIDSTAYGNVPYPPGWIWDDLSYSFAAPLMTTIIDHNFFTLKLKTPKSAEKHPIIETNLPKGVVHFSNELAVINNPKRNCPIRIYSRCSNDYVLRGCYYRRWKQQVRKIAIRDVPLYAKVLVRDFLTADAVHFRGPIEFKQTPKSASLLAEHFSPPLKKVIKEMLKESDNLTTNAVFKKLGQTYFKRRGTWQNSLKALRKLLEKSTDINFKNNLVNDGAGLSRYNLLSPRQLSKVLNYAYHNKTIHDAFINALPIAGKDGTMKYRLQDQGRTGRIHAKTGSMTGVTALAGYVRTKYRGTVSFVIVINGVVKPRKPFIIYENEICRYLVNARYHG